MKILFIDINMHAKNANALFKYNNNYYVVKSIDSISRNLLESFDCVYSPAVPIDVRKYPGIKFIFGPHFSVFPEKNHMNIIRGKDTIYIQPSEWAAKVWENNSLCNNIKIRALPFGVDTDKFNEKNPIQNRRQVFVYYKSRHPDELKTVLDFFKQINVDVKVFSYMSRYREEDYINCLHNSKFGVWIGRHESQGFALEEALSCNIPLLVWDVSFMSQEYGYNYSDIPATCIPYWDERCGESFKTIHEFQETFNKFTQKLELYKPREYILENLSIKKCEEKLSDLIKSF